MPTPTSEGSASIVSLLGVRLARSPQHAVGMELCNTAPALPREGEWCRVVSLINRGSTWLVEYPDGERYEWECSSQYQFREPQMEGFAGVQELVVEMTRVDAQILQLQQRRRDLSDQLRGMRQHPAVARQRGPSSLS